MAAAGVDFISFTADGARHRYRFDHGLHGPGDLDVGVRIRLKLVLLATLSSDARFPQHRLDMM